MAIGQIDPDDPAGRSVRVARRLIAEGGLPAVTIAAVSRAAKVSNGSLYHWFGDRSGLLEAAQQDFYTQLREVIGGALVAHLGDPRQEQIHALVSTWTEVLGAEAMTFQAFTISPAAAQTPLGLAATEFQLESTTRVVSWLMHEFGCTSGSAQGVLHLLLSLAGVVLITSTGPGIPPLLVDTWVAAILGVLDAALPNP